MSAAANYDDVLQQLRAYGLEVDELRVGTKVPVRVKAEGDRGRQKSGWYVLHELRLSGGDLVLVGAYGNWRDAGVTMREDGWPDSVASHKIKINGHSMTPAEREAVKARIAADRRAKDRQKREEEAKAAKRAQGMWKRVSTTGECEYLDRKGIQAHGARFTTKGNMLLPMHDVSDRIVGLQVIYGSKVVREQKGRDKDFWPPGVAKKGSFFRIGAVGWVIIVCEGFATGASLYEATGYPVAVAWDAGNLVHVAQALRRRYPQAQILIAGDDDWLGTCKACKASTPVATAECQHCGEPHGKSNTGASAASGAAMASDGQWLLPEFADRAGRKLTDFNDLHLEEGLHVVRQQVEAALDRAGWKAPAGAPAHQTEGGGDDDSLRPIQTEEELLERFALVYGHGGGVFDFGEHALVSLSDMRDACASRDLHRRWQESTQRQIVRIRDVGFDPTEKAGLKCNLWSGWPTKPQSGKCTALLDLLDFLCADKGKGNQEMFDWLLKWLAYPIQHPGAKMKTAVVLHGPQGAGKNMFFEAVMAIYGEYGRVIDQASIEDKFNDWASKKLFLIADEVVARNELFHVKNKLKHLITGDWIRINPKNVAAYDEHNHANLVFLSNEAQPLVLERDDRRYAVVWTPPELPTRFYTEVKAEIDNGGIEALHDYLLNVDLTGFAEHTRPPMTESKAELIDMGLDSTERFYQAWVAGDIDPIKPGPCLTRDLYELYRKWCNAMGISKAAPQHILLARLGKRPDVTKRVCHYVLPNGTGKQSTFLFPEGSEADAPDGMQQQWLGQWVEAFRNASDDWSQTYA